MKTRAIAIFCDDIREEKSGQDTLIGIFPDNMSAPRFPVMIPKLGLYLRVLFDINDIPKAVFAQFKTPWDEDIHIGQASEALISQAARESSERGIPVAGIILKAVFSPFQLKSPGTAVIHITVDGEDSICGVMNILETPATSSSAPALPT